MGGMISGLRDLIVTSAQFRAWTGAADAAAAAAFVVPFSGRTELTGTMYIGIERSTMREAGFGVRVGSGSINGVMLVSAEDTDYETLEEEAALFLQEIGAESDATGGIILGECSVEFMRDDRGSDRDHQWVMQFVFAVGAEGG